MMMSISLVLALAFLISVISVLSINKTQRDVLARRLGLRRLRASGSFTPPRSLSPEKQGLPPNEPPAALEYKDVFPPCGRTALADLICNFTQFNGLSLQELSKLPPDLSRCVPDRENVFLPEKASRYTPTGFSMEEVKALGDFPDYATLSGVPLPQQYPEFDISKAVLDLIGLSDGPIIRQCVSQLRSVC